MHRHTRTCALAIFSAAALIFAIPGSVHAQFVGENVNMVTGTGWPDGDPFLQRQNEPSIAVSSANPQHLLAGANDYRLVDVPVSWKDGEKMAGDAWLGVFKSLDGGQTWKSYLLPGFPQENPQTAGSKLYVCGTIPATRTSPAVTVPCTSAADPIVRAGPDGVFYFGGIAFNRSAIPSTAKGNYGKVFLTRYVDLNNKEDGNAAAAATKTTDPIRYVDQKEIALGGPSDFVDKPWVAVDVPRTTNTCTLALPDGTKKVVAAHTVYVAYLRIVSGTQSDVMVRHSDDCGNTWSNAVKVSDASSLANEGPSLAIDPVKGYLYVTWRRVGGLNAGQGDAILLSRTFSRGNRFTKPRQVATVTSFDQPTTGGDTSPTQTFRVTLFPSSAISVDAAGARRLHVAWAERTGSAGGYGDSRVMVATKLLSPPPVTEYEPDENDSTCQKLDAPRPADNRPVAADGEPLKFPGNQGVEFAAGHQFMPSLTFSQGRLMLVYYDSRLDHTRAYHKPHTTACTDDAAGRCWMTATTSCASDGSQRCWTLNAENSYYDVVRGPWGAPVLQDDTSTGITVKINGPETLTDAFGQIFTGFLDERTVGNTRHTVDVRVASALPTDAPDFGSIPLSKFPFGTRGDEGYLATRNAGRLVLPGYGVSESSYDPAGVTLVDTVNGKLELQALQQLKMNPPNLPIFRNGTVPFLGDYIDIQGPAFVKKGGKWVFNTDPTPAPVFHAVWTSNEDVRAPLNGDWTRYVPINANSANTSAWNGGPRAACRSGTDDVFFSASRNQNVYTARITDGLAVLTPQNSKPLSASQVRSFVVTAINSTAKAMTATYRFTAPAGVAASWKTTGKDLLDLTASTVTAVIAPHSNVSRTLFVKLAGATNSSATLTATVTETGGASGSVTLNPPGLVPGVVTPPDSCTGPAAICSPTGSGGEAYATIQVAANLSNANLSNANLSNANLSNANLSNANLSNANLSNANLSNANLSNAALANLSNANLSNANLSNANLSNANLSNANLSNASVSDLNYEFQNTGNTTTSYAIKIVATEPKPTEPLQLILARTYTTPVAVDCSVKEEPHNHILASIDNVNVPGGLKSPGDPVDPNVADDPSVTNATLTLAPGEKAQVTLRGRVTLARMAEIGTRLTPRPVAQATPKVTTVTYASLDQARVPTQTAFTSVNFPDGIFIVAVTAGNLPAPSTGTVTLVVNDTYFVGVQPIGAGGVTEFHATGLPSSVTKVTAFYSGIQPATGTSYAPSNGNYASPVTSHWTPLAPIPTNFYSVPDRGVAALNGKVFLFGGLADGYVSDVLQYDTATASWVDLGTLTQAFFSDSGYLSFNHAPTRAANLGGRVFSVSSWYLPINNPDLANPEYLVIEEWGATGSLGIVALIRDSGLRWPQAVVGLGGKLYILGGNGSDGTGFTTVQWDPSTGTSVVEPGGMTAGLADYSAVAANGKVYLMGGAVPSYSTCNYASLPAVCVDHKFPANQDWWTYTPGVGTAGGQWSDNQYSYMPTPRHSLGMAVLGGKIFTIGGIAGDSWSTNAVNTVEVFDPATETWAVPDPNVDMNIARVLHSVVEVGGRIYAIGGYGTLRAVGVFTP